MSKTDQERIVRELLNGARTALLQKLPNIPDGWDGHELRQWVADYFTWQTTALLRSDRRRLSDYKQMVLTRNL
jgi:hypothetical protein